MRSETAKRITPEERSRVETDTQSPVVVFTGFGLDGRPAIFEREFVNGKPGQIIAERPAAKTSLARPDDATEVLARWASRRGLR